MGAEGSNQAGVGNFLVLWYLMMMNEVHAVSELDAIVITLGKTAKFITQTLRPDIVGSTFE